MGIGNNEELLLQYAMENNMIDLAYVREQVEMKRRKDILEKHPYKIWQGKDLAWYTYLPDDSKGRKLKRRTEKKRLEDFIIDFYMEKQITSIGQVFEEWSAERLRYGEIKKQTYDRYCTDYHRFFDGTEFVKRDIHEIDEYELEKFIKSTIRDQHLTSKAYSGLRLIIRGMFKYAKARKYTDLSISQFFGDLQLSRNLFTPRKITKRESVFTDEEIQKIEQYISQSKPSLVNYGILLTFQTGVRVGELSALTWGDVDFSTGTLDINKTEVRYRGEDGKYVFEVRESAKTDAGNRMVILNSKALRILRKIRALNPFGEYLFMRQGKRIKEKAFSTKMAKICESVGIPKRSMHKVRKTYATNMLNQGVDESLITEQMGHTDISCTKKYYYYDNTTVQEARAQIEKVAIGR